MKILFVSASPLEYSASANMRNLALLSGFIKNGHDVFTLTPKPQEDSKLYDKTLCNINIKKKYYIGYVNSRKREMRGTKIYELLRLAETKDDFIEADIIKRTNSIIERFMQYISQNGLSQ